MRRSTTHGEFIAFKLIMAVVGGAKKQRAAAGGRRSRKSFRQNLEGKQQQSEDDKKRSLFTRSTISIPLPTTRTKNEGTLIRAQS